MSMTSMCISSIMVWDALQTNRNNLVRDGCCNICQIPTTHTETLQVRGNTYMFFYCQSWIRQVGNALTRSNVAKGTNMDGVG